jgi:hypothetical protein
MAGTKGEIVVFNFGLPALKKIKVEVNSPSQDGQKTCCQGKRSRGMARREMSLA